MNQRHTIYAQAHVATLREQQKTPTWDDVATAYDMGLTHALTRTGQQRKHLRGILQALRMLQTPEPQEASL